MKDCVIGIIGGGIGALTTALALDQAGFNYQVIERAPAIAPVEAGIWLLRRPCRCLSHSGFYQKFNKQGIWLIELLLGEQT